ncbi:MAG: TIGR01777 family oxidoreductase [Campylobacterota bacterium]|nr:TIGR01777 family oxidoreductase [Campylobacterota bacterium]
MKKIVISGASGFVGSYLQEYLKDNYAFDTIKRNELNDKKVLLQKIEDADIVINLAGANIIHRWTSSYKELLYSSRIDSTGAISDAINASSSKPMLISTSAIGIYDTQHEHDEESKHYADDFLSNLCQNWEAQAKKSMGKVAIFRFGVVLGQDGGALSKMLLPFKLGVGGKIGSGKQHFSYIHIEDLARAYKFIIELGLEGTFNLTTPNPTTNLGVTKALGKALSRPTLFPVPEFALKMIYGEGATVLTDGQKVIPTRLIEAGFDFKFKTIDDILQNLV